MVISELTYKRWVPPLLVILLACWAGALVLAWNQ